MTLELIERAVRVNGHAARVWSKGQGTRVGFLPGVGGLPKWTPFLDRLAMTHTVVAPSLPGFPGALGHDALDTIFDWVLATHDLISGADLYGEALIGVSVSGALAADVAGVWPDAVRKLILIAPFGLFDPADPTADIWAQRPGHLHGLLCAARETYSAFVEQPANVDPIEWKVEQMRALEASARFLFPTGNTGLGARLHRIRCPLLLLRGSEDRVIPRSYLERFAANVSGPVTIDEIPGAGHLAELDRPELVARAIERFVEN